MPTMKSLLPLLTSHQPVEMPSLLLRIESLRLDASSKLDAARKAELGQFFSSAPVARLMAGMLECDLPYVRILDPGAGVGSLFAACVAELCHRRRRPERIEVTAYEIDGDLIPYLEQTLELCRSECEQAGIVFSGQTLHSDFISAATEAIVPDLFSSRGNIRFNCAILNPPYRKISSASTARQILRRAGIETTNLYTAFLALTVRLLDAAGELVAITPRSFCNGLYFRGFRASFLRDMTIRRLHLFESRVQAFRDDDVLQENVILHALKTQDHSGNVIITSSAGPDEDASLMRQAPHTQVVHPDDPEHFIRIVPDELGQSVATTIAGFRSSLEELGLTVSTGRVVDFRARKHLRQQPEPGCVPLIYPTHFANGYVAWPNLRSRKPNCIVDVPETKPLLVPNGNYVLVRRFSSKEEPKRIVAAVYEGARLPTQEVAFENHINYYHQRGSGFNISLDRGLAVFLNSSLVDAYFRQFNGHTQVNATDLRSLRYPTLAQLESIGALVTDSFPQQAEIDEIIESEVAKMGGAGRSVVRAQKRIEEVLSILTQLGFPREQINERSALTLLALLDLTPESNWTQASNPLRGITPIMEFAARHYGKTYAPNTRETFRRFTMHQFVQAGLAVPNPDDPERPTTVQHMSIR